MDTLLTTFIVPTIPDINNNDLQQQLQQIIDLKTKPIGAMGRLESLGLQLGMIQGSTQPQNQHNGRADDGHAKSAHQSVISAD